MRRIAMIAALALAGCSHTQTPEPIIRTVEVQVPVDDPACARKAKEALLPGPAYPDTDQALREAPNLLERVRLLLTGRTLRIAQERALTDAITECAE